MWKDLKWQIWGALLSSIWEEKVKVVVLDSLKKYAVL